MNQFSQKRNIYSLLGLILWLWVITSMFVYADTLYDNFRYFMWTWWTPHVIGQFTSTGWNTGVIWFWSKPIDGYSGANLYITWTGGQLLTGSFWIETVWWINLMDIGFSLTDTWAWIWSLSWYAWSDYAGWVDFSGVTYHLSNTSFSGYAWNDNIGWIDMADASLSMTSSGAIWKVKILGNLWGNSIFNTTYSVNSSYTSVNTAQIINEVQKNTSLELRNIPYSKKNTTLWSNNFYTNSSIVWINNMLIFENTGSTVARARYTDTMESRIENVWWTYEPIYSVIAIGSDVYIDDSVLPQSDWRARVIIALKNSNWVGGNIYIHGWLTQIKSTLITEWSVYSWEFSAWNTIIYNNDPGNLFKIPNRQLYVYGSVISNNTIWWYGLDNGIGNICPYNITPCNDTNALIYDFNHFRDFQKDKPEWEKAVLRWYPNNTYDAYSIVIEYDQRIISNPPPGLERIN